MNNDARKPGKRTTPSGRHAANKPNRPNNTAPARKPNAPGNRPKRADARPGRAPRADERPRTQRRPSPRDAALALLRTQAARWPDLNLAEPDTQTLDPRDAAFAHALYDLATRHWLTSRFLAERHLTAPWSKARPEPRAALIAGITQLLYMRSVPPHAAVNETVTWARHNASRFAAGLVNAVLRKVAEDIAPADQQPARPANQPQVLVSGVPFTAGKPAAENPVDATPPSEDATPRTQATPEPWRDERNALPLEDGSVLRLADHILPEDPLERLAVATSHPVSLLAEWIKHAPMREVRDRALHGIVRPPTILNTQTAKNLTDEDRKQLTPHTAPGHHVFKGPRASLEHLLAANPTVWVQDPASSLAVQSVIDLDPGLVIDYCAGRGTKTQQLAAVFPNARIVATDIDRPRHASLTEAFKNTPNVEVIPFESVLDFAGKADLVLLDVPCSNTGVLARRVEARYRVSKQRTDELTNMQRQIIADSIRLLRADPGAEPGKILYSTCSLDPKENEEQAAWAQRWHAFERLREHRRAPSGLPGDPPENYSDGSYAVLLA